MTWTRLIAGVLIAALMLCGPASAPAWAQSAPPAPPPAKENPGAGAEVAAAFSNIIYVPGKATFCAISTIIWASIMALTFGHSYNEAAVFPKAGCGGKWAVRGEDIQSWTGD